MPAPTCRASRRKTGPLRREHFEEFEKCYGKDPNGLSKRKDIGEEGRFREFASSASRNANTDSTSPGSKTKPSKANELPEPQDLASEAITELEAVRATSAKSSTLVEKEEGVEK